MAANQIHPCMWCQTPHRHLEDCPECAKPVDEDVIDRIMKHEANLNTVRTLKLKQLSMDKTRTEKLQGSYPVDGEYQPEGGLCDAWGNILVWGINRKAWEMVSMIYYKQFKVCYSHWAYLPQIPEIKL